jgi:hypothetical protein
MRPMGTKSKSGNSSDCRARRAVSSPRTHLAAWSRTNTPKATTADKVRQIIDEGRVFVEETLVELLEEVGFTGIAAILDDL